MTLSSFDDLLQAARAQREPQRLLFVFAGVGLPDDATPERRQRFEAGQGGALAPLQAMVEAIRRGQIGNYILFDAQGDAVQIS